MSDINSDLVAALERRNRILLASNVAVVTLIIVMIVAGSFNSKVIAQDKQDQKVLKVSELTVVDEQGRVRVRIGGELPDVALRGEKGRAVGVERAQSAAKSRIVIDLGDFGNVVRIGAKIHPLTAVVD